MTAEPKKPTSGNWIRQPDYRDDVVDAHVYDSLEGIRVLSAVEVVSDAPGMPAKPEFHVSISLRGGRADRNVVRRVLRDFDMRGSKEDNHLPKGKARHFWLPVGVKEAPDCACVHTEKPHDEGDEYVWREVPGEDMPGVR